MLHHAGVLAFKGVPLSTFISQWQRTNSSSEVHAATRDDVVKPVLSFTPTKTPYKIGRRFAQGRTWQLRKLRRPTAETDRRSIAKAGIQFWSREDCNNFESRTKSSVVGTRWPFNSRSPQPQLLPHSPAPADKPAASGTSSSDVPRIQQFHSVGCEWRTWAACSQLRLHSLHPPLDRVALLVLVAAPRRSERRRRRAKD